MRAVSSARALGAPVGNVARLPARHEPHFGRSPVALAPRVEKQPRVDDAHQLVLRKVEEPAVAVRLKVDRLTVLEIGHPYRHGLAAAACAACAACAESASARSLHRRRRRRRRQRSPGARHHGARGLRLARRWSAGPQEPTRRPARTRSCTRRPAAAHRIRRRRCCCCRWCWHHPFFVTRQLSLPLRAHQGKWCRRTSLPLRCRFRAR